MALTEKYAFRDEMVRRLSDDLFGPGDGPDEVLDEPPLNRYVAGVLWPQDGSSTQEQEPDDPDAADSEDTGAPDMPVSQARMRYPSSAGLTFSVDAALARAVTILVDAARYVPGDALPPDPGQTSRAHAQPRREWRREGVDAPPISVPLDGSAVDTTVLPTGLRLHTKVREPRDGLVTVTATLVNEHPAEAGRRDENSWFQVALRATTDSPAFVDRAVRPRLGVDDDSDTAALLYRDVRTFAAGHGCSVGWPPSAGDRVSEVWTTFLPTHRLPRAQAPTIDGADLRMATLATNETRDLTESLRTVVRGYRAWLDARASDAASETHVPAELQPVAAAHLAQARRVADRIDAGIRLLETDPTSLNAFRLMNQAMLRQRVRQDWVRGGAVGDPADGQEQTWRAFQIAFVVMNLPALADPGHPDRDVLDLLWFPTGGGKTEAYLGLIAFTLIRRRLVDADASGVGVLMRYTLRLLTIQQFERATTLICALETLRRENTDLGTRPFSVGLWVGRTATPNTLQEAQVALGKLKAGRDVAEGSPIQLEKCPWCGNDLGPDNYDVLPQPQRHLRVACRTRSCDFATALPVHLVDDDVYRERPDLLIGTVDKFARMAWTDQVRVLFGRDGRGGRPQLIIQDELHLIAGPLGSMVGLYETAVDAACSLDPAWSIGDLHGATRPKIVASTATIRRATEQVRSVFDRDVMQFPPPGLDPDHTFFAEPADATRQGDRAYVGVMAPGTTAQTLMVRVYASLLHSGRTIDADADTRDPYWTLIGYFNSLRVLGSAELQVRDDVQLRLDVLAGREVGARRSVHHLTELTSRVPASEIPNRLKNLETGLPDPGAADVVLATNMISVGLDVDRLGLMVVMGQPQSSAEYIQATSRVGRKHPGLVVAILNPARSRDRSHFENFVGFHQAVYRSVEATSATPFAARARDRGLHGVLTSLVRLLDDGMAPNNGAGAAVDHVAVLRSAADLIAERAQSCAGAGHATATQLDELIEAWLGAAGERPDLSYSIHRKPDDSLLISPSDMLVDPDLPDFDVSRVPWATLSSLRDVDAESGLYEVNLGGWR